MVISMPPCSIIGQMGDPQLDEIVKPALLEVIRKTDDTAVQVNGGFRSAV